MVHCSQHPVVFLSLLSLFAIGGCSASDQSLDAKLSDNVAPPEELHDFEFPIELITAWEYSDGGTAYVKLQDSENRELEICVSQYLWDESEDPDGPPNNTLYIGAQHYSMDSSREPLNEAERNLIIASLKSAVDGIEMDARDIEVATRYDPAECHMAETGAAGNVERELSDRWKAIYAKNALHRLENNTEDGQ